MKYNNTKAFSMIEILVGMFIFSLGILSTYAVIMSSMNLNEYNKNYIIASNLAREQLELMRNIRDSNYIKVQKYNQIDPSVVYSSTNPPELFSIGMSYTIENDYSPQGSFPIKVRPIADITDNALYDLCLDGENRYVHECGGNTETYFYKYITISEVEENGTVIENAFKVKSKVTWYKRGYHEFEVNTIIADWKRL